MRGVRISEWVVAVLVVAAPWTQAQTAGASAGGPGVLLSSSSPAQVSPLSQAEIVREIDDPHNGDRWLLERDPSHPGGPGLLKLISNVRMNPMDRVQTGQAGPGVQTPAPVIRPGDRVIVEEHTRVVDARLDAVALSPAAVGSAFNVRLTMGGGTMRAVALGPGRAVFEEEIRR